MQLIDQRASQLTTTDIALAAEKATKTPSILVFSEVASATADVRAAIEVLEKHGVWFCDDLPPRLGVVHPQLARIDKGSAVFAVSGAIVSA